MNEIWKTISGHEDYSASSLGRIRNDKKGLILKPYIVGKVGNQYAVVDLNTSKHKKVHRIVALTFIPNPENKREVNHIDGDHFNNAVSNLEWVSGSENCKHAYRVLGRKRFFGSENATSKKIIRIEDGRLYGSVIEAAHDVGLKSHTPISKALKTQSLTAGGYHWKYA